jgi:hypothetical protein
MTPENAEILALEGLGWLAAEPDQLQRFLNLSGLDVAALREAAGTLALNLAVLDFLLGHEPDLLRFCESLGINPADPARARRVLAPDSMET